MVLLAPRMIDQKDTGAMERRIRSSGYPFRCPASLPALIAPCCLTRERQRQLEGERKDVCTYGMTA